MTAPLRSTPHSQLPTSQTAPVAEFRCLYTPDIRKKQKKWQDGYLKFHSFNNRVMVYDQARNFLGDTYYKDSNELHEGDELTLDKGVMVEVADAMGVTQTDLTPLFEKKPKEVHPHPTAPPRRFQPPSQVTRLQVVTSNNNNNNVRTNSQLRHKSLNTLLGTPKGPIGKSVPIKSPYEARQEKEKENDFVVDRVIKRRKTAHSSTSSATLRLSSPAQEDVPASKKTLSLGTKISDARRPRKPAEPIPQGAPVIILDDLDPTAHVSSDASLPSTPPQIVEVPASLAITPAPPVNPMSTKKPVLQTPKIPRGKVPVPSVKALETPKLQAPASSPPVSASNRLTNVEFAIQLTPAKEPIEKPSKQPPPPQLPQSAPRNPKAKTLRLSAGMKRGTLMMCQPPPPPRAKGNSKGRMAATNLETAETSNTAKQANSEQVSAGRHLDASNDDQEGFHGSMDQQLVVAPVLPASLPGSSSEPKLVPDKSVQAMPRSKAERNTVRDARKTSPTKTKESEPARMTTPLAQIAEALESRRKLVQKPQSASKASPVATPVTEPPKLHNRAASPALSVVSEARPRTASMSPQKLAALSTDDLRRNLKRATPQPTSLLSGLLAAPYNEAILLQSHSLHGNKKAPVMTTTELAAMLQKPKKKTKVTIDSIKNGEATSDKGSDRKFKHVHRENDAPIPSTSENWEKKNLLKSTPKTTGAVPTEAAEAPKAPTAAAKKNCGLAALVKKTDPRRKLVRTQNLNINTNMPPAQDMISPTVSPVADTDIGPWSTEAFDLFDWRPPRSAEVET